VRIGKYLGGERAFWLGIGGGTVVVLLLLFVWAAPAHRKAGEAERELDLQLKQLQVFRSLAGKIPSARTVRDRAEFRTWLDNQADQVGKFFAERASLLDAPIAGGSDVKPEDFKEAYIRALARQREWFARNTKKLSVPNVRDAFSVYPWVSARELPSPAEYPGIRRAYWSRHYLYRGFLLARVTTVSRLAVGKVKKISSEFDGLQFQADLLVAPDRVKGVLEKLLRVSPSMTPVPVIALERMDIRPVPSSVGARPLCSMKIGGYILIRRSGV